MFFLFPLRVVPRSGTFPGRTVPSELQRTGMICHELFYCLLISLNFGLSLDYFWLINF